MTGSVAPAGGAAICSPDGTPRLQRFQLLIQIGAQTFQFDWFGEFLGGDLFVVVGRVHSVIRVGVRNGLWGRGLQRGLAVGHFSLIAQFLIRHVIHGDLCLRRILCFLLRLFGGGVRLIALFVVIAGGIGFLLIVLAVVDALIVGIVIKAVWIVAQLIAIAEIGDHLARKPCKGGLVRQCFVHPVQRFTCMAFHKAAPEFHDVGRLWRQITPGCKVADQVVGGHRQRRF
jgi:hypothetical protein